MDHKDIKRMSFTMIFCKYTHIDNSIYLNRQEMRVDGCMDEQIVPYNLIPVYPCTWNVGVGMQAAGGRPGRPRQGL